MFVLIIDCFFFSSRRRHKRYWRDWSSDVCSSDLTGFFDDRSSDRLGMEADAKLVGSLSDMSQYVKENRTDVIFIALPIRHVKRVMNLLDDLRDTTASIYYVPDIFV